MLGFASNLFAVKRHHYLHGIFLSICLRTVLIALLVEAIFLAERFAAIFGQGVSARASTGSIALLLLLSSPEIFDLAFAVSLLVGVYQVLLRAREDRELLAMTGAGMSIYRLAALLLGLAVVAQATSLFVSGTVGPAAQFAQRNILFDAQYRVLRYGAPNSQFYFFRNHVVFVEPEKSDAAARHVFILEQTPGKDRIMTGYNATLDGPDASGRLSLHMRDFAAYEFENRASAGASQTQAPGSLPLPDSAPTTAIRGADVTQQLQLQELIRFEPRGTSAGEWTLLELLGILPPPAPLEHDQLRSLGERVARSLLCLLAPFLAALALALMTRATQSIALPLACLSLLGLNMVATAVVDAVLPLGNGVLLGVLGGGAVVILLLLTASIVRLQHALILPALSRL